MSEEGDSTNVVKKIDPLESSRLVKVFDISTKFVVFGLFCLLTPSARRAGNPFRRHVNRIRSLRRRTHEFGRIMIVGHHLWAPSARRHSLLSPPAAYRPDGAGRNSSSDLRQQLDDPRRQRAGVVAEMDALAVQAGSREAKDFRRL